MANAQPLELLRRSASTAGREAGSPGQGGATEVAKLIDVSKCIGCKACQAACLEWNDLREEIGYNHGSLDNPLDLTPNSLTVMRFTEWENPQGDLEWLIRKDGCMHCSDPGCLKACPAPGAIVQYTNGIVDFVHDNCIGCGYCLKGCPFNIPRFREADRKAFKCTLCSDRAAVGQGPACAKACPTKAISFGSKDEMKRLASERIEDLKERGFAEAGLYDPQGVSGTHVMYVLHHADKPEIYAGLPATPRIDPKVELWKGGLNTAGLWSIAVTAALGLVHYLIKGANRVSDEDERRAAELEGEA
jgi:formate dehydrogenase iron-sulfur subunit